MGLFFDDKKDVKKNTSNKNSHGVIGAAFLMLLGALVTFCFWLLKMTFGQYFETLKHLLDFRNVEKEVARKRIAIAVLMLALIPGIPLYYLYKVPAVRDYLTLSQTRTINVAMPSGRIFFPNTEYFTPTDGQKWFDLRASGASGIYLTYPLQEDEVRSVLIEGFCQLVTRGLPITIISKNFPLGAEGFEKKVTYYVTYMVTELPVYEYVLEVLLNPRYVWKSKEYLSKIPATFERTTSWETMKKDWGHLTITRTGNKAFEIKAHPNQYAMICI